MQFQFCLIAPNITIYSIYIAFVGLANNLTYSSLWYVCYPYVCVYLYLLSLQGVPSLS